ncbi:7-cyano-7-deazaguanine synthase QueC [Methanofollis formosanus]|uniref:7-cyano-7-deazaguanine synthase n=1 Tax=Methanofollis formosanus TaxID=299308 RepID=A0A8G1A2G2_9EURY|nr:7-cyano-7-deazaguanine synthase QueC [Methanofollis formosanus]QYZ79196.1 7-cyano-7-deazaguanine synthase QueC [Methanofollis formosanus]
MRAVCLLSGGMDSTTLSYVAADMGYEILALHLTYGQLTEEKERACAKKIAGLLGAEEFCEVDVGYFSQFGASALVDPSIPVKDFRDEEEEGVPRTYVPFRNGNLLAMAVSYAESRDADAVFIGVQSSDYSGYPDCRPEFIEAFQRAVDLGTAREKPITLMTPFVRMNKTEILRKGVALGVPYEHTWSCYQSSDAACGVCESCHFRLEAFRALGIEDPIPYRERA